MASEVGKSDRRTNEEYLEEQLQSVVCAVSKAGLELTEKTIASLRSELWESVETDEEVARMHVSK